MTDRSEAVSPYSSGEAIAYRSDYNGSRLPEDTSSSEASDSGHLDRLAQPQLTTPNRNTYLFGAATSQSQIISPAANIQKVSNCYARGTRILTLAGEVAVEALQAGDLVVTFAGGGASLKPVRRLGRRKVDLWQHPEGENIRPIRIRADALDQGCPRRDLVVSPSHRMRVDNVLVAALELVNGASIVQETPEETEYWHLELDGHDLILAEGAQAETVQDIGNRAASEHTAIAMPNPMVDGDTSKPCLPHAEVSTDMRARLIARAEMLGWAKTVDPAPWLEVNGKRVEPIRQDARCRFTLQPGCKTVRLRSHEVRPWDVDAHSTDRRHLGLKLHRLALDGPDGMREVALTSPTLRDGFNAVEHGEDGWIWRWTTGDALLDLTSLTAGETVTAVEIDFNQALPMWIEPEVQVSQQDGTDQTLPEANLWALAG